jgi:hypothetical protein
MLLVFRTYPAVLRATVNNLRAVAKRRLAGLIKRQRVEVHFGIRA